MYLHIPPELHTLMTSLTHPRKILLVVLQIGKYEIGKAKDLSAPYVLCSNSKRNPYCGAKSLRAHKTQI
jgi:hypothetical protein